LPSKSELALKWPVFRPRNWGKPSPGRALAMPWFGLDTERDAKTGEFVCGWIVGETIKQFKLLTDLEPGTYWVWNLGYDIEGMLRDLRDENGWAARADGAGFSFLGGEARYFHGKRFDFKRDGKKWAFLEASSFFGRVSLSKIGAKEGKVKAAEMSKARYDSEPDYRADVDSYCRQDSRIVYNAVCDLAMGVRTLGVELGSTPGATARRFLTRLGEFPPILFETQRPFLKSYCGGRFEIVKRGIFDFPVYQYDLVSAYPWALAQCPWLTESARQKWTNRFSDEALYGTYDVSFKMDEYLGIAPRWNKGVRIYSREQDSTWLARPELKWLQDHGIEYKINHALEVFDPNATDLWRQVITELFAMKNKGKGKPEGMGAKIILNSQYGVLIQLVRRAGKWVPLMEAKNPVDWAGTLALEEPPQEFEGGKYYAPLYAGDLTARTRIRLLDAARALGDSAYIGGHTDSVLGAKPLPDNLISEALGGWKLEKKAPNAEVAKTGVYAIADTVKVRGITRTGTAAMIWSPTQTRRTRTSIKSAQNWNTVSLIREKEVMNSLAMERKRLWHGELSRAILARREYIDSEALANVS
jgi:hypothetical protein